MSSLDLRNFKILGQNWKTAINALLVCENVTHNILNFFHRKDTSNGPEGAANKFNYEFIF